MKMNVLFLVLVAFFALFCQSASAAGLFHKKEKAAKVEVSGARAAEVSGVRKPEVSGVRKQAKQPKAELLKKVDGAMTAKP